MTAVTATGHRSKQSTPNNDEDTPGVTDLSAQFRDLSWSVRRHCFVAAAAIPGRRSKFNNS